MIPIVQFPSIIERHAPWFDAVFATDEQRKHFREYVTGLIVGNEATITAINNLFLERNDQSALNKFLTQAVWAEQALNRRRVEWELAVCRRNQREQKTSCRQGKNGQNCRDCVILHRVLASKGQTWEAILGAQAVLLGL